MDKWRASSTVATSLIMFILVRS